MEEHPIETLSVGVYSGLEAEYQIRSGVVYVRDPEDPEQRCTQVSLARWSRFLTSVKAGEFTPQQEGDLITITIGDQSHAAVSPPELRGDQPTHLAALRQGREAPGVRSPG